MADKFEWQVLETEIYMTRARVPGGWFVTIHTENGVSAFFYPDARHVWNGASLPPPPDEE